MGDDYPHNVLSGPMRSDHCACGMVHDADVEVVVIDERAVEQLVAYAKDKGWTKPFAVMDANTKGAAGSRVLDNLSNSGMTVASFCFPERSGLLADETSVSLVRDALEKVESDSILAVGSGVITDITRYVASGMARRFVSVPTAASMDGYASSVAAMEFGGMKASFPATAPIAVFADTTTIAAAPLDMTRAGLGDLLAKASARVDWLISHLLYGEHYCATLERRVTESLIRAADHVEDVLGGSPAAVGGLLRGLVDSGVAMAMVGSSRPASGCEHHASHFWDLLAANGRRRHTSHGLQVGYATQFAMRLQQYAFGGTVLELASPRPIAAGSDDAASWFAGHGAEVAAVIEEKRRFLNENASRWPTTVSEWESVQASLREAMGVFPLVARALLTAGIPDDPGYLGLDTPTLKTTFRVANRIRSRYTVLDFLEGQGRLVEAIDAVIGPGSPAF